MKVGKIFSIIFICLITSYFFLGYEIASAGAAEEQGVTNILRLKITDENGEGIFPELGGMVYVNEQRYTGATLSEEGLYFEQSLPSGTYQINIICDDGLNIYFVKDEVTIQDGEIREIIYYKNELAHLELVPKADLISQPLAIAIVQDVNLPLDLINDTGLFVTKGQDYHFNIYSNDSSLNYIINYDQVFNFSNDEVIDFNDILGSIEFNFSHLPSGNIVGKYVEYAGKAYPMEKRLYLPKGQVVFDGLKAVYKQETTYRVTVPQYGLNLEKENTIVDISFEYAGLIIEETKDHDTYTFTPRIISSDGTKLTLEKLVAGKYQSQFFIELFNEEGEKIAEGYDRLKVDGSNYSGNFTIKATLLTNPLYGQNTVEKTISLGEIIEPPPQIIKPKIKEVEFLDKDILQISFLEPYEEDLNCLEDFEVLQGETAVSVQKCIKNDNNMAALVFLDSPLTFGDFTLNNEVYPFESLDRRIVLWCSSVVRNILGIYGDSRYAAGVVKNAEVYYIINPSEEIFVTFN